QRRIDDELDAIASVEFLSSGRDGVVLEYEAAIRPCELARSIDMSSDRRPRAGNFQLLRCSERDSARTSLAVADQHRAFLDRHDHVVLAAVDCEARAGCAHDCQARFNDERTRWILRDLEQSFTAGQAQQPLLCAEAIAQFGVRTDA